MATLRAPRLLALLALAFGAACASEPAAPSARVRPLEELPTEYATAWRAWYDQTGDWPEWRERVTQDPALASFFVDNLLRVLVRNYDQARLTTASELPGRFERARRELIHLEEQSGPVLVELLLVGDGVVSYLAGDLLDTIDDGRWSLALARKLENDDAEERRRAAEWLAKLPHAGDGEEEVWRLLRAAVRDPEWFVRAQVALTAGERGLAVGRVDLARPVLLAALEDADLAVVQSACEALRRSPDPRAVPGLIRLYERIEAGAGDLATLRSAQRTLVAISGARGPQSAAAWEAWWRENRP